MKTSQVIRQEFISFFEDKNHKFVRSSPVVPQNDPTLLFTNAGMNQFKDLFLGTGSRDYTRAVNSQKCIRASGKHNDLEDVGRDNYHHTFFEMLGNWSFGDYFKKEAIRWAWELLVDHWGLDPARIYATVFEGSAEDGVEPDEEAERYWFEVTPIAAERVMRFGKKDNFWEMGDSGPNGPCSEVHYDLGAGTCPNEKAADHQCGVNVDGCWRFIELWNLVFIQYNRLPSGELQPLPAKHVDTGLGLERIVRVMQGHDSNYGTDLFTPLLAAISQVTGRRDEPGEIGVAFRVIADHLRALSFAIADGAFPSNEGRGYVLRRILRRAARFGRVLEMHQPFIYQLVPALVDIMGGAFPELKAQAQHVARVIQAEEESFGQTLDRGLELFEQTAASGPVSRSKVFPGADVFKLYDTFGFPADLTRMMAEERGLSVEMETYDTLMEVQRRKAKAASMAQQDAGEWVVISSGDDSVFTGYQSLGEQAQVRRWRRGPDGAIQIVLNRTPFYAESGGQVGDRGRIKGAQGEWEIVDVQREGDRIVHIGKGPGEPGSDPVTAEVDPLLRASTTLNHTATHLLQAALKRVLGSHVNQAGSIVHADYLRFDYTHFEKPREAQLEEIEKMVNREIRANTPLTVYEADYDEAVASGVVALFGEKYGDRVRVVKVGEFSAELCGGCHVMATGDIGQFVITSESSIAAGVRRIAALTGEAAESLNRRALRLVEDWKARLNAPAEKLSQRLDQIIEQRRELERDLKSLKKRSVTDGTDALLRMVQAVRGVNVLASEVEADSVDELRALADSLRRQLENGVAVIGSVIRGKATLLSVVTDDLVRKEVKAGEIVNLVAHLAGGRGGGPPHMATGGAKDISKFSAAIAQAPEVIESYLGRVLS